jgi:hypothetical protein
MKMKIKVIEREDKPCRVTKLFVVSLCVGFSLLALAALLNLPKVGIFGLILLVTAFICSFAVHSSIKHVEKEIEVPNDTLVLRKGMIVTVGENRQVRLDEPLAVQLIQDYEDEDERETSTQEDRDTFWKIVVDCLVAFHDFSPERAEHESQELRTRLESPPEAVNEWEIYLHEEPFAMADGIANGFDFTSLENQVDTFKEHMEEYQNILKARGW